MCEQKKPAEFDLLREARFTAAIAGDIGVPVVFVPGDQTACREMKDLIGPIEMTEIPNLGPIVVLVFSQWEERDAG
ncbi:MAG: M55 family metallopeptidase [Deltaproteobacteria bacterium]|nr:M55 family metallopeptidase [Deltaproteobacteria bacterium]